MLKLLERSKFCQDHFKIISNESTVNRVAFDDFFYTIVWKSFGCSEIIMTNNMQNPFAVFSSPKPS